MSSKLFNYHIICLKAWGKPQTPTVNLFSATQ